ncbi:MAG: DoxX family protein [Phycisphaeraceae bacterium]
MLKRIMRTQPLATTTLIRIMVGAVFLSEGIQKFLYPEKRGAGRFESIGLPSPELLGYWVASWETLCGTLLLVGLLTRLAAVPTLVIMCVALVTTKLPMLSNDDQGFWYMAHAMRTDWAMFLGSIFLIIKGAGCCSVDAALNPAPIANSTKHPEHANA